MGNVYSHNIRSILSTFNLENYVETGTGRGDCLSHMIQYNLKKYHSIEIHPVLYQECLNKFKYNTNCVLHLGNSYEKLVDVLKDIDGNTLFFLDAHFPGSDFGFTKYSDETDKNKRIPLENELNVIKNNRDTSKDVLIIDDLRIYEDGPFEDGNWDARSVLGGDGIDFIYDLFETTHNIEKLYSAQGYIVLTPKI